MGAKGQWRVNECLRLVSYCCCYSTSLVIAAWCVCWIVASSRVWIRAVQGSGRAAAIHCCLVFLPAWPPSSSPLSVFRRSAWTFPNLCSSAWSSSSSSLFTGSLGKQKQVEKTATCDADPLWAPPLALLFLSPCYCWGSALSFSLSFSPPPLSPLL